MRRIREGTPLSALNFTAADEDWGVYLLFGDERDESGMGDGDDGGGDGGVDGGGGPKCAYGFDPFADMSPGMVNSLSELKSHFLVFL